MLNVLSVATGFALGTNSMPDAPGRIRVHIATKKGAMQGECDLVALFLHGPVSNRSLPKNSNGSTLLLFQSP